MASKLGFLLSSVLLLFIFLAAGDLLCISTIKSGLDSLAVTVGYRIAKEGTLSQSTRNLIANYGATISSSTFGSPAIGETFNFTLSKEYAPLIMSKDTMVITVAHSAVVGFYDSYY